MVCLAGSKSIRPVAVRSIAIVEKYKAVTVISRLQCNLPTEDLGFAVFGCQRTAGDQAVRVQRMPVGAKRSRPAVTVAVKIPHMKIADPSEQIRPAIIPVGLGINIGAEPDRIPLCRVADKVGAAPNILHCGIVFTLAVGRVARRIGKPTVLKRDQPLAAIGISRDGQRHRLGGLNLRTGSAGASRVESDLAIKIRITLEIIPAAARIIRQVPCPRNRSIGRVSIAAVDVVVICIINVNLPIRVGVCGLRIECVSVALNEIIPIRERNFVGNRDGLREIGKNQINRVLVDVIIDVQR